MDRCNILFIILSVLITSSMLSCKSRPGLANEEKAIRDLLLQERKAHFDRNADLFISEFADSMISVNKGKVTINTVEQNRKRIEPYFSSVQFIKWDDTAEPLLRFSEDGSLAYAIIQKQVIVTYPDTLGKPFYDTTNYAWVSIYRKQKDKWKAECNVSTNK
jgi:hypothetical protein